MYSQFHIFHLFLLINFWSAKGLVEENPQGLLGQILKLIFNKKLWKGNPLNDMNRQTWQYDMSIFGRQKIQFTVLEKLTPAKYNTHRVDTEYQSALAARLSQ